MRILAVTTNNSGVGYHRLMLPIYYMKKDYAYFTDVINDEILSENFDLVVINRLIPNTHLEQIKEFKKKYGFKLLVDIDDYWHLDAWHVLYRFYPTQAIIDHIKYADFVTCTNELLYQEIKKLNDKVEILPNALPFGYDQFTDEKTESDKVTIVYTGSLTHEKDIRLLKNPLKRVLADSKLKEKTRFILCGYNDDNKGVVPIWQKMIADFTCSFQLNSLIRKSLPVDKYMNFYNDADISLVPLVESKFNCMKSNLKVLEAAAKKIPAICSNILPYKGNKIIEVNNQRDWYKAIKKTSEDAIYRIEKGIENYLYCYENFHLDNVNQKRYDIYSSLIKN